MSSCTAYAHSDLIYLTYAQCVKQQAAHKTYGIGYRATATIMMGERTNIPTLRGLDCAEPRHLLPMLHLPLNAPALVQQQHPGLTRTSA
jgi:hypothetical protein